MSNTEPNTNTLANNLADQIRMDIEQQDLAEGTLFMTGDEVAARYGVSRGIAREAISQLRALGMLKSRQGKGLLIGRSDLVGLFERGLPFYGNMPEDVHVLAQLRYVLEIGSVDLAVTNGSEAQIRELGELAQEYQRQAAQSVPGERGLDTVEYAFHSLILKMTGNPIVHGMHTVLSEYFEKSIARNPRPSFTDPGIGEWAWEHAAIASGFRDRDREATRAYLRRHLRPLVEEN